MRFWLAKEIGHGRKSWILTWKKMRKCYRFLLFFLLRIAQIFQCLYVLKKFQEVKNILHCKLHYILVWNILIVSFMYLKLNWNMSAVSIFSYHWYSLFYAKNYHFAYYNEQRMYLATLWSALIFQYIHSL